MTQVQPSTTPHLDANVAMIEALFLVIAVPFRVGGNFNRVGTNLKTLAILGYAKKMRLTIEETLLMFGEVYDAVLKDENGDSHPNIRALMLCMSLDEVDFGHLSSPLLEKEVRHPNPVNTAPTNEQLRHPVRRRNNLLRG